PHDLHAFPTRRSSELGQLIVAEEASTHFDDRGRGRIHGVENYGERRPGCNALARSAGGPGPRREGRHRRARGGRAQGVLRASSKDRKSTRLNSSHVKI